MLINARASVGMLFFITWPITSRLPGNAEDKITLSSGNLPVIVGRPITSNHW